MCSFLCATAHHCHNRWMTEKTANMVKFACFQGTADMHRSKGKHHLLSPNSVCKKPRTARGVCSRIQLDSSAELDLAEQESRGWTTRRGNVLDSADSAGFRLKSVVSVPTLGLWFDQRVRGKRNGEGDIRQEPLSASDSALRSGRNLDTLHTIIDRRTTTVACRRSRYNDAMTHYRFSMYQAKFLFTAPPHLSCVS
jgi:hypothetical protein